MGCRHSSDCTANCVDDATQCVQDATLSVNREAEANGIEFSELFPQLNSGDLILYTTNRFSAAMTRTFTYSTYDHIGIVIALKKKRKAFVLEADATGVGLFDLEKDWLQDYPGRVYHRALELPRDISRADVSRKLMAFSREIKGRPYEKNLLEMARAAGIFGVNEHANLSSLFCSELVAEALQRMELLPKNRLSNMYVPKDFSTEQVDPHRRIQMQKGASYGKERMLLSHAQVPSGDNRTQKGAALAASGAVGQGVRSFTDNEEGADGVEPRETSFIGALELNEIAVSVHVDRTGVKAPGPADSSTLSDELKESPLHSMGGDKGTNSKADGRHELAVYDVRGESKQSTASEGALPPTPIRSDLTLDHLTNLREYIIGEAEISDREGALSPPSDDDSWAIPPRRAGSGSGSESAVAPPSPDSGHGSSDWRRRLNSDGGDIDCVSPVTPPAPAHPDSPVELRAPSFGGDIEAAMAHSEAEAIAEALGRTSPATDGESEGEDGGAMLSRPSGGGLLGGMVKSDGAALTSRDSRERKGRESGGGGGSSGGLSSADELGRGIRKSDLPLD